MIGGKTVGPEFAASFRKIGVVAKDGFERSNGAVGLKGFLEKIANFDHLPIMDWPEHPIRDGGSARTRDLRFEVLSSKQ